MASPRARIGIDVGGTFTDFILADLETGSLALYKEPSVPGDPSLAVERGMSALLAKHDLGPDSVELVVHGTTIGLNAIIQRRGARMALVVSEGNRDVLELARLRLPSSYDFTEPREIPLVPRNMVFPVHARMRADGTVLQAPDDMELATLAAKIRAQNVEAVAVMFLNSYRDASLEIRVADSLRAALPGVLVSESGLVWPEVREYERCLIAGLNAYIHPLMGRYLDRLRERVRGLGVRAPIYITANNGGTLSLETARERPVDTILSGPASGVVASTRVGATEARGQIVTFDMGGTSADIAICTEGVPAFTTTTQVGDFPLMMPVVNVAAIGAGGGSLLWVDTAGLLKVGPLSAGADPGPVSYGRGGTQPTLTDCYLALGILDPTRFLGGRMALDRDAAVAALDILAAKLGHTGAARGLLAAEAALRVASAKMAAEIIKLLATAGADPRGFALVAYGGAGPTHANLLAEEARLPAILVPTTPGAFCALGAILADVRRDYVRTVRHLVGGTATGWAGVAAAIAVLEEQALAWVALEGNIVGAHALVVSANMRYPGQAYELEIHVPEHGRATLDGAGLAALFHAEHERRYGFSETASAVEVNTVRLGVIGRVPPVALPTIAPGGAVPRGDRELWRGGTTLRAAVYDRGALGAGATLAGPAIIEQEDTTTFVLPGWAARVDAIGTLHITRGTAA